MPDITEAQIYEAMGLGAKEQEPAAPAPAVSTESNLEGAKEQEPAAPANGDTNPNAGQQPTQEPAQEPERQEQATKQETVEPAKEPAQADQGKETPAVGADKEAQTEQQRRDHAAQRRREEQQAAIDAAVQDAIKAERDRYKAEMDAFFATANLKNTITSAPITNMEEFNAWKTAFDAAKLQRDLKAGKLTPEGLSKAISENPTVKKAEEIIRRSEENQRRQDMAAAQARVDTEIQEIQKLDPTIRGVKDLLNMPTAKEFYAYVKKGNSFLDAFYLANRERLNEATAEAAKQQAMNNARSKDHLTTTAPKGAGAAAVPADELAMFREFMPGATEAEIQAYYNKYKRGG